MSSLVKLNGIKSPYRISIGQKLQLPATIIAEPAAVKKPVKPATTKTATKTTAKTAAKATTKTAVKAVPTATVPAATKKTTPPASSYTPPNRSGVYFAWPLTGKIILPYGTAGKGMHNDGINIAGKPGQNILAAENGVVAYTGNELAGYGNLLLIKHADGWMTAYAHNDSITVKKGQNVRKGQSVAKAGKTGNVSTTQLHFEIRRGSKPVDPMTYLEKK